MVDGSSASVAQLLQDVIGKEQHLRPDCGRLREIHARIAREVQDAKNSLHLTVKAEWPTLEKQFRTTTQLSRRIDAVQSDVTDVEDKLDGSTSALRPRLQAALSAHAALADRHRASETLIDLLATLQAIQSANAATQACLNEGGRLEDVVPALQRAEALVIDETEPWKRSSERYKKLKMQTAHLRTLAQERLEAALESCISVSDTSGQSKLSISTSAPGILLPATLQALAELGTLAQHLERLARKLVKKMVAPLVIEKGHTLASFAPSADSTVLVLQRLTGEAAADAGSNLASLRRLTEALQSQFLPASTTPNSIRKLFYNFFLPPVQQLIVTHLMQPAIPDTAETSALSTFAELCQSVAEFEAQHLLSSLDDSKLALEPVLQAWAGSAGMHWSKHVLEKCYSALRQEVATSAYWNQTMSVDWLDDPERPGGTSREDEEVEAEWQACIGHPYNADRTAGVIGPLSAPLISSASPVPASASLPAYQTALQPRAALTTEDEASEEPLEDAWGFVEGSDGQQSVPSSPLVASGSRPRSSSTASTGATVPRSSNVAAAALRDIVEESPDVGADGAWGFADEGDDAESGTADASVAASASERPVELVQEEEADSEAFGWSFEDGDDSGEAATEAVLDADRVQETASPAVQPPLPHADDPDKEEDEPDWDAWAKPELEQAARPIGKPTKVVSGKRLGGVGRRGTPTLSTDAEGANLTTDPAGPPPISLPTATEGQTVAVPPPALEATPLKREKTLGKLLVSSRTQRVVQLADELLDAALAVSAMHHARQETAAFAPSSPQLFQAFCSAFDLYRAIVPVAHKELITTVPSIGMQFANDCLYVSREGGRACRMRLRELGQQRSDAGSQEKQAERVREARRAFQHMRSTGEAVMDNQLELQRVPLMDALDEADGLRNTDVPATFQQCQRSIRQIVSTLTRLSHAWKPVMLRRRYYESMGILVNAVLLRVLVEIENQEDISEESSLRLNDLCKMLHELESLFVEESATLDDVSTGGDQPQAHSSIALHVPVWFKFKFLSELLEASMADIMFLFNEGHLVDFSSTELTKLVRALFSESQLRTRNLETIARGR